MATATTTTDVTEALYGTKTETATEPLYGMKTETTANDISTSGSNKDNNAMTAAVAINDENTKPPPAPVAEAEEDSTSDIVLAPVDPRLSAPSITTPGTRLDAQVDRRKRLFAAKRVFAEQTLPRRKRVAKKSLTSSTKPPAPIATAHWDDYFHNQNHQSSQIQAPSTYQNQINQSKTAPSATTTRKPGKPKSTKPKPNKSSKASTTKTNAKASNKPMEVHRGPPDDDLGELGGWPPGWIKTLVQRTGGNTKGTKDRYWFSPGGRRFRSMKEVKRFLTVLASCGGDEEHALKICKR